MSNINKDISGIITETRKIIAEQQTTASAIIPKQLGYGGNLNDWVFLDKDKILRGHPIGSVIDSWLESFTREETKEWIEKAQCFLPVAAIEMKEAGITPEQAATIAPPHVGRKSYKDTVGYKVACGDLDVDEALDFVQKEVKLVKKEEKKSKAKPLQKEKVVEAVKKERARRAKKKVEDIEIVDGQDNVDAKKDSETWPMASIQAHVPAAKDAFAAVNAMIDSLKGHAAVKMYDPSYDGEGFVLNIVAPRTEVEEVRGAVSEALESADIEHKLVFSEIEKLPEGTLVEFGQETKCIQCQKPISEEEFQRNAGLCDDCASETGDDFVECSDSDGPVEAYGVRGMKSKPWRKTFKNQAAFEKWLDENEGDVEVHGTRDAESRTTEQEELEERTVSGVESQEGTILVIPSSEVKSGASVSLLFDTIMDFESVKEKIATIGEIRDIGKRDSGYWIELIMFEDYETPLFAIRDIEKAVEGTLFVKSVVPTSRMAASKKRSEKKEGKKYKCPHCGADITDDEGSVCPECGEVYWDDEKNIYPVEVESAKTEEIADEYGLDDDEDTDDFEDEDVLLSDDEEDVSERTLDAEPPDFQPGDAVTVDMGEGPVDAIIADGDEDNPYRKKHDLFGELDVDVFLVDIIDEESEEVVQTYVLAALLK